MCACACVYVSDVMEPGLVTSCRVGPVQGCGDEGAALSTVTRGTGLVVRADVDFYLIPVP